MDEEVGYRVEMWEILQLTYPFDAAFQNIWH
jgi:hypothetical protein